MSRTPHALCLLLLLAARASAQPAVPAPRTHDLTWIAVGAGGGIGVVLGEGVEAWPAIQVRVNMASRVAAEIVTDVLVSQSGLAGLYELQVHFAARPPDRRLTPFFTVGALGYFETRRIPERRSTLPTGDLVVYPARRLSELSRPFGFIGGGGVRVRMTRRSSFESGAELWLMEGGPVIAFNTGVVVSLGPRR